MLELRATRLLRRQLELDKHHVVADPQCQGERRAARQEVTDLQANNRRRAMLSNSIHKSTSLSFVGVFPLWKEPLCATDGG